MHIRLTEKQKTTLPSQTTSCRRFIQRIFAAGIKYSRFYLNALLLEKRVFYLTFMISRQGYYYSTHFALKKNCAVMYHPIRNQLKGHKLPNDSWGEDFTKLQIAPTSYYIRFHDQKNITTLSCDLIEYCLGKIWPHQHATKSIRQKYTTTQVRDLWNKTKVWNR